MYIVEIKNTWGTCEKEFTRKGNAVKAAAKVANDGYVYFDNPYLHKEQRKFVVEHVRVYSTDAPDVDIDF